MLDTWVSDGRYGLRSLFRQPGFTAIAVLVMAIGIGAVTVMYSALEAVVLRPLPYAEPERLVWAWSLTPAGQQNSVSAVDYLDYRAELDSFESLAAYYALGANAVLTGGAQPERVPTTLASHNLFATLAVRPAIGRFFVPADEEAGAPGAVVIAHALWQRRFGGRPDVLGTVLTIDGRAYEIVGVAPATFDFPQGVEIWEPMRHDLRPVTGRGNRNFRMFGRLAAGATIEQAQTQASLVASRIANAYPEDDEGWGIQLQAMHEVFFGAYRPAMLVLLGAVTLLLVIACANVSSLVLARAVSRRHDVAIRLALGASRGRIAGQLVVEGVALAGLGGAFGVLLSVLGIRALKALAPPTLPRVTEISLDPPVVGIALAASVLSGLIVSLVPAVRSGDMGLADGLRQGARATGERAGLRLRNALVVVQVALSAALLVSAGVLAQSLARLYQVDPGFRPEALLLTAVQLPGDRYDTPEKRVAFVTELRDRLTALPDVVDVAGAELLPFTLSGRWNTVWRADRPPRSESERVGAQRQVVTRGYFKTLGIPLLRGRNFEPPDRPDAPPAVVINQALADLFWPGEDPLGAGLVLTFTDGPPAEVVGIVADIRQRGPDDTPRPAFYVSYEQFPFAGDVKLAVRARGETAAIGAGVRETLHELDPTLALARFDTMEGLFAERIALPRFRALLVSLFSAIALVLSVAGLYGVLAFFVAQRTKELGLRMALGADAADLTRLVVRRGMILTGAGMAIGLPAGIAGARLAESLLFQTAPLDPALLAGVAAALALASFAACMIPAVRATRVDPLTALHAE